MKQYSQVALGGTFDRLHAGHRALIDLSFNLSERVSIGVADSPLIDGKHLSDLILPFHDRTQSIKSYITKKGWAKRFQLFRLRDIYGTCLTDKTIQALVVTRETYANGVRVNALRVQRGLPKLKLIIGPLIKGENKKIIRSEIIRLGDSDRDGCVYTVIYKDKNIIHIPDLLRNKLKKPLGQVVSTNLAVQTIRKKPNIFSTAIGDFIMQTFISAGIRPAIQIIDNKINRKAIPINKRVPILPHALRVYNRPGTITHSVFSAFRKSRNSYLSTRLPQQIIVVGEEDLTALVAILCAPLESIVFYGQPGRGIVRVVVSESLKVHIFSMLRRLR